MPEGCRKLGEGPYCEIWARDDLQQDIAAGNRDDKARVKVILEHVKDRGHEDLPSESFVREGRFPSGIPGVADQTVYAVKAFQIRLYGGYIGKNPRRFVCVEGAIKKKNSADQRQLKRVAKTLGMLNERSG